MPLCSDRIAVSGEPNPKYDANGVSRDRSIIVEFTKVPAKSSFIFSHSEVPEGAEPLRNEDGEIWAYKKENGEVFLKNILITNADGYSLADHFTQPVLDEKLLTIAVDKKNPIEFEAGVLLKTILVTLSENISDTDGVCMTAEKSWRYQISEVTDEKATVGLTCDSKEGSVYLAGSKDYSIGQKITLSFTENADYQFIKWEYDENFVHIADEKSISTTATVINKTDSEATVIKAVCAPRLRVKEFSPEGGTSRTSSKNSSVILKFSHDLPDDSEGKAQLSNIMITVGGSPVKSSFLEPVISGDTLSFSADKSNMLDVATGQTKTVTVSVPADFYYLLEDGTKVTYGGNGISFDYKIDETTLDKAEVTFASYSGSGTITTSAGSPAGTNTYSEGQEITITFNPSSDWQFNGWSISAGGNEVSEDKIRISDKSSPVAKLTVCEAVQGVTVKAEASEKLSVSSTSPNAEKNAKDSSIEIKFNKTLDSACSDLLSSVKVSMDGVNADSYFANRSLNENKITLTNTRHLSVAEGAEKTVTVTVPNSFYYIDGSVKVALEQDYSFTFTVDGTSAAKAEVTFSQTANAGTVSPAAETTQKYSLDTEVPISFVPASGWQFNGWSILDSNKNEVDSGEVRIADKNSASTTMHVYGEAKGLTVRANASEKLSVTGTLPSAQSNSKDSSISINFNKPLDSACSDMLNKIKISLDGVNVDSSFNKRSLNGNKITLTNTKYLNVTGNENKTVTVTVPNTFFYMDGSTKVSLPEEYTFEYTVNSSSNDKAQVSFNVEATGSGTINQTGEGGYSMGSAVALKFNIDGKYQFNGWTITDSEGKTVGEDKIKIENPSSVSTTMYVYQAVQDITVNARASEKLSIKTTVPSAQVNPKDSSISITFNKPLDSVCENLLSDIKISMDGSNVGSFFAERKLNAERTTITLKNTKILNVTGSEEKTVTVTLPSTFFYKDGDIKVSLEKEYSFDYKINSTTDKKATVTYKNFPADSGDISPSGTKVKYSIGETVGLTFNLKDGYKFTGWTVTDSEGNAINSIKIDDASLLSTKITFTEEVDDAIVRANAILLPAVVSCEPSYESAGVECDTPIVITFNKAMKTGNFKLCTQSNRNLGIQISNPSNEHEYYEEYFNEPQWNEAGTILTLRPKKEIRDALVKGAGDLKNIRIAFDLSKASDTDGNKLKEADTAFVYRINHNMETIAPEVTMKLYKRGFDIEKNSAGEYDAVENSTYTELSSLAFTNFATETYPLNHVGAKIYFDATATDSGSGYKQLTIQETLIKTVEATDVEQKGTPKVFTEDSFTRKVYEFQSQYDGVVQLDFIFEDYAGNKTTISYYVIKDTNLDSATVLNPKKFNSLSRIAQGNSITETLDYSSNRDTFYSDKNEICSYRLIWGYDDNYVNSVTPNSNNVFTFTREDSRHCWLCISTFDSVGNIKTIKRVIPKQFDVLKLPNFGDVIYNKEKESFDSFASALPATVCKQAFVTYQENENSTESVIGSVDMNDTYTVFSHPDKNGIFRIYLSVGLLYTESTKYFGPLSKPFVYYRNYTPSTSITETEPEFPSSFEIVKDINPQKNVGYVNVQVIPASFTQTEGYSYGVCLKENGVSADYEAFNFLFPSYKEKTVTIYAENNISGKKYESTYKKNLSTKDIDNIPPTIYLSRDFTLFTISRPNRIVLDAYINDTSGLFKNSNNETELEYYLIKKDDLNSSFNEITEKELQASGNNKLYAFYNKVYGQGYACLSYDSFIESYYILTLNLRDIVGNNKLYSYLVSNRVFAEIPQCIDCSVEHQDAFELEGEDFPEVDNYKLQLSLNNSIVSNNSSVGNTCISYFGTDNKWKRVSCVDSKEGKNITVWFEKDKILSDFIELCIFTGSKDSPVSCSLYKYLDLEYELKSASEKAACCKNKAVIPGLGGAYQVYYDAPCFAHTMAFPTNMLGDLDAKLAEAKSIDSSVDDETYIKAIWETKGREYGLKLINSAWLDSASTSTYTAPVSEIPSGYSYVTVFHFADGTSVMSEVKGK